VTKSFGQFVIDIRTRNKISLRQFCINAELDPSNWSKVERGVKDPPIDDDELSRIAVCLGIAKDSVEWITFFDLARIKQGRLPNDIISDKNSAIKLPMLFRTIRGQKLTEEEIQKLIEWLRSND
jgi:transcriptional regulator with XRE-family HTH domain